jgi:hypothetical protein
MTPSLAERLIRPSWARPPWERPPWARPLTFHIHLRSFHSISAKRPAWDDVDAFVSSFQLRQPEVPRFVAEAVGCILSIKQRLDERCQAVFDIFM